ncbi:MAG: hypothetical protein A2600_04415 [Candidatus Lambdaproteobacteria bacterium RIFOXYD1_FULL_56_27]|uniref:Uncharacterized protein n=1 Tax=Candidatus Lambdaproteobacteria bacterium RIFOXYD2_FULL_56_26 TaxID=1817773 RepID=A0A1F6H3P5_9PROT|nr:MAG: hypothetical protein A2426_13480 [Candidatus Lambdaproteobacteria bacterium RIFOXYC1_FULL_56_13]OGH04997.1 MAG: hypothetical protein A2557_08480 [Candidatus Lambdaproteobacteria bacterium RIFOXYD2_FULL_56_26]OGH09462.1 MAG: hypothetical protein A2600_04415 [Candidatus Lambdaproteobacteria bacterium RIFOXYD1_FULL_56_27]
MKQLFQILGVHSVRELVKYKSFFLLVFLLFLVDRLIKTYAPDSKPPGLLEAKAMGLSVGPWVFEQLPGLLWTWALDGKVLLLLGVLFLLKQAVSIWPSSDMRRMHRDERQGFGLWGSLKSLRWDQVAWDFIAALSLTALTLVWATLAFLVAQALWAQWSEFWVLVLFVGLLGLVAPVVLGGLSFSSKLAVLHQGSFGDKLGLFFLLFTSWPLFWRAWLFFSFRTVLEGIFVGLVPASALLWIDSFWLRLLIAGASATPVYSFVKMASFKFFLYLYKDFGPVRQEYQAYYRELGL